MKRRFRASPRGGERDADLSLLRLRLRRAVDGGVADLDRVVEMVETESADDDLDRPPCEFERERL